MAEEGWTAIDYPALIGSALVGVVRGLLVRAAEEGMPGAHHFYLSFRTAEPGVELPPALVKQFPNEMTIVLQHQFWGLAVDDTAFSVTLRFAGAPRKIRVPFSALTAFADPSVPFGLRLAPEAADGAGAAQPGEAAPGGSAPGAPAGEARAAPGRAEPAPQKPAGWPAPAERAQARERRPQAGKAEADGEAAAEARDPAGKVVSFPGPPKRKPD